MVVRRVHQRQQDHADRRVRVGKGKEITNSGVGGKIQIQTPLDFYMVADHAEFMGVFNQMANPDSPLSKTELAKQVTSPDANVRIQTFAKLLRDMSEGKHDPMLSDPALARSVWSEIVKAADANYQPGKFTTFAGFEWTSNPDKRNLHRVVVFRDTAKLPDMVLSSLDSDDPETLWKWMTDQRANGSTLLAIPHNGNASDGRMFELVKFDGKPIDARVQQDARRERTVVRNHADQRDVRDEPGTVAKRRVREFRAVELHVERRRRAANTYVKAASRARRCSTACRRTQPETAIRSNTASSATPTRTTPRRATKSSTTPASSRSRTMRRTG